MYCYENYFFSESREIINFSCKAHVNRHLKHQLSKLILKVEDNMGQSIQDWTK